MKQTLKTIICSLLIGILCTSAIPAVEADATSYATEPYYWHNSYIMDDVQQEYINNVYCIYSDQSYWYKDANGNYIYQTHTRHKISGTYIHTIGFTFSRIKENGLYKPSETDKSTWQSINPAEQPNHRIYNGQPHWTDSGGDRQTFDIELKDADAIANVELAGDFDPSTGRQMTINTWVFDHNHLMDLFAQEIGKKDDWWKTFKNDRYGNTCWLGIDAIIQTYNNYVPDKVYYWYNYTDFKDDWGAAYGGQFYETQFKSYYNQYFASSLMGKSEVTEEEPLAEYMYLEKQPKDDDSNIPTASTFGMTQLSQAIPNTSKDKNTTPHTYTYNVCNDYELGTAIPTSEKYTNEVELDTWYGTVKVKRYERMLEITVPANLTWETWHYSIFTGWYTVGHSDNANYYYTITADCYALADINLAQLAEALVTEIKNETSQWNGDAYKELDAMRVPFEMIKYSDRRSGTFSPLLYTGDDPWAEALYGAFPDIAVVDGYLDPSDNAEAANGNAAAFGPDNDTMLKEYYIRIPNSDLKTATAAVKGNDPATYENGSHKSGSRSGAYKKAEQKADEQIENFCKTITENTHNDALKVNGANYLETVILPLEGAQKIGDVLYAIGTNTIKDDGVNRGYTVECDTSTIYDKTGGGTAYIKSHMVMQDTVEYPDGESKALVFQNKGHWEMKDQQVDIISGYPGDLTERNQIIEIPEKTANGPYYTKLETWYNMFGMISKTENKANRHLTIEDGKLESLPYDTDSGKLYPAIKKKLSAEEAAAWTYTDDNGVTKQNMSQKNEAIRVHSPVLTPISIVGEDETQLVKEDAAIRYDGGAQLILDNTYTISFDWDTYFKQKEKYVKGYDGNKDAAGNLIPSAGWTKFISEKRIRFPYSVEIKSYDTMDNETGKITTHTVDRYFEPIYDEDGNLAADSGKDAIYTEWISFQDQATGRDSTISIQIYLPAWANEGSYVTVNEYDAAMAEQIPHPVQIEVRANNYSTETNQKKVQENYKNATNGAMGEGHNGSVENPGDVETYEYYAAAYEYPTEVSGVIYGFQINTINNPETFLGRGYLEENESVPLRLAQLVPEKKEKTVGMKNRIGGSFLRYTYDGEVVDKSSDTKLYADTLPLTAGKSGFYQCQGYLQRGNTFSFTLKTIADLSDPDDKIVITPEYRYYDMDGNTKEIELYYDSPTSLNEYIGRETEEDMKETYLWDEMHQYCYYDYDKAKSYKKDNYDTTHYTGWFDYADKYIGLNSARNMARRALMTKKSSCYRLGHIEIGSGLRLLTGNEEELRSQLENSADNVMRYQIQGVTDEDAQYNTGDFTITQAQYDDLADSMQTWYGTYSIPGTLKVVDVEKVKQLCGDEYNPADDPLWNYLMKFGSFADNEEIFINDGYLVLNFDIKSLKNDGTYEHLQYYGNADASLDMWKREQGNTPEGITNIPLDPPERLCPDYPDPLIATGLPEKHGDIAVIHLDSNAGDYWRPGVLYAN